MKLVAEMTARVAKLKPKPKPKPHKGQDERQAKRQAEFERQHRRYENNVIKAARSEPHAGFEMPPMPERPALLTEMAARRAKLGNDRMAIETELAQLQEKQWRETNLDDDARDAAAEALAAGEVESAAQGVVPEHLEVLRSRLDLVRRAENKLVHRLAKGNASHNRALASALRPQHRAAVRRIHAAVLELAAANAEEAQVRSAIPGVPLESFSFPGVGTRGPNGGGQLHHWIGYVKRFNMLAEADAQPAPTAAK